MNCMLKADVTEDYFQLALVQSTLRLRSKFCSNMRVLMIAHNCEHSTVQFW